MVGLQRPQGDPGLKPEDLEEDNKMICLSNTDEFVLTQVQSSLPIYDTGA